MSGPLLQQCTGQGGQTSTQHPSCAGTKPPNFNLECQTSGTICAVCDLANAQSPKSRRLNDVRGPTLSEVKLQQAAKMLLQPPTWLGVTAAAYTAWKQDGKDPVPVLVVVMHDDYYDKKLIDTDCLDIL